MAGSAAWLDWDGRCVRWQLVAADGISSVELRIDGVTFERVGASVDVQTRDFSHSPTGNADIEFSLLNQDGVALAPPWRVTLGRAADASVPQWNGLVRAMRPISAPAASHTRREPVAIVIPIFNAAALVERCIESVVRWTSAPTTLILIDDASTDPAIDALLRKYAGYSNISILRNAENIGYTKSSNRGIEASGRAHVLLLNSDTQVGPRWLDRLVETASSDASIGTVTAVSDNAGAFSVPELERFNSIPAAWTLEQTQRALLQRVACPHPELPTGNGFCMFIKRMMLDDVGALDADAFPFGYGEENDLCQRAERVGYRHVIAGDVLVAHARSASFGDERRAELGAIGMAVLRRRYPDYETKVGATLFSFARRVLDYRVRRIYSDRDGVYDRNPPLPRLLKVIAHPDDVAASGPIASFENFAARGDGPFDVYRHIESRWQDVARVVEIDALADWLVQWSIECLCVYNEGRTSTAWRQAADKVGIPVVNCPTSADEIALSCGDARNSIAAFRSS